MTTLAAILKYASDDFLFVNGLTRKSGQHSGEKAAKSPTCLELQFLYYWRICGGVDDDWRHEVHPFSERPRMHVDFMHVTKPVAIEIDGGQFMKRGGHSNPGGIARDAAKLALCNQHGITLFRLPTAMVNYEEVGRVWEFVRGINSIAAAGERLEKQLEKYLPQLREIE